MVGGIKRVSVEVVELETGPSLVFFESGVFGFAVNPDGLIFLGKRVSKGPNLILAGSHQFGIPDNLC